MAASKAQRAKTAERRAKAIKMRIAGLDWETIAERLEYASRGAACTDVNRALAKHVAEERAAVEVLRQQEVERLDRLMAGLWTAAAGGDPRAADTVLRIIDRRCKLLGVDPPERHQVQTIDAIDASILALEEKLGIAPSPDTFELDDIDA